MAYLYNFEVGLTYAGRVNVESLSKRPCMAPKSKPITYPDIVTMASGRQVGRGFPTTTWDWGDIRADMFANFRAICPGPTADVIIRTLAEDYSTYGYYSAKMIWPAQDSYEYRSGVYRPFSLAFTHMLVYTP